MVFKSFFSLFLAFVSLFGGYTVTLPEANEVSDEPVVGFEEKIDLEAAIKAENIDELTLTVYGADGDVRYRYPPQSITGAEMQTEVTGDALTEHIDLLYKIKSDDLTVFEGDCYVYAQAGFVLESAKNGKLIEVILWSHARGSDYYYNIRVNGVDVYEDQLFYDVMNAYASQEILDEWGHFFDVDRTENY